jgi:hypothetical protein
VTPHPRMGSSLLLSPLLLARGMRGTCNGSNVHHCGENSNVKSKMPLPGAPNVKKIYDTSPGTTTRAFCGVSLMEGLSLSSLKQDGHGGLCGSGRWSVIPYVHREDCGIVVCGAVQALYKRVCLLLSSA